MLRRSAGMLRQSQGPSAYDSVRNRWLLAFGFWLLALGFWLWALGFGLLAFGFWLLSLCCSTLFLTGVFLAWVWR